MRNHKKTKKPSKIQRNNNWWLPEEQGMRGKRNRGRASKGKKEKKEKKGKRNSILKTSLKPQLCGPS